MPPIAGICDGEASSVNPKAGLADAAFVNKSTPKRMILADGILATYMVTRVFWLMIRTETNRLLPRSISGSTALARSPGDLEHPATLHSLDAMAG